MRSAISFLPYPILSSLLLACSAEATGGASGHADPAHPPDLSDAAAARDAGGRGPGDDGPCSPGTSRECWPGDDPPRAGVGACRLGRQGCEGGPEFGAWGPCVGAVTPAPELCGDGVDQDCDGTDPGCDGFDGGIPRADGGTPPIDAGPEEPIAIDIYILGDCVTASCPPEAPYPVGCTVSFSFGLGSEPRGCVASRPDHPVVYFQAGDDCDRGIVAGTLYCATSPGAPLDQTNCPIDKPTPIHVSDPSGCPDTH